MVLYFLEKSDLMISKERSWKYATIGLAAVLVVSMTIPGASAAPDVAKLVQQILDIVKNPTYGNQAIKNAITGLQGSAATEDSVDDLQTSINALETKVDGLAGSAGEFQIIRAYANSCGDDCSIVDFISCTSDSDYLLHVYASGGENDYVTIGSSLLGLYNLNYGESATVGGFAGQGIAIVPVDILDDSGNPFPAVQVTLQTSVDAAASCEVS